MLAKNGALIVTPIRKIRKKSNLRELVAAISEDYRAKEIAWGKPVGTEEW